MKRKSSSLVLIPIAIITTILMGFPFFWMLLSSFKSNSELFSWPPKILPSSITFEHYVDAISTFRFGRYFFNSVIVAVLSMLINVFFCSLAGYAFACLEFPYKKLFFVLILATMIIPVQITLIPTFLLVKNLPLCGGNDIFGRGGTGLLNTHIGLAIPHIMTAFGVFMMRQFYSQFPKGLLEAARIDGAREFAIFFEIFLPLSKPGLSALAIFTFTETWNDFLWPLVITRTDKMRTIQLGLEIFKGRFVNDWGPLMAATVISSIPIIVVFILFQKQFMSMSLTSGMK